MGITTRTTSLETPASEIGISLFDKILKSDYCVMKGVILLVQYFPSTLIFTIL